MKLNVGIIGGGSVAQAHLAAYSSQKDVSVKWLADVSDTNLKASLSKCRIENTTNDYRKILDDPQVSLIDVCVPPHLHRQVGMEALGAGKNVIIEKPIALTLEEADSLINQAASAKRRLFVALNQRFLPAHIEAKHLLLNGEIGKAFLGIITCIGDETARMRDPKSWKGTWEKAGGGALADTGVHLVDLALFFFGRPVAVTAATFNLVLEVPGKGDDTSSVILEFESGAMAQICVTYVGTGDIWSEKKDLFGTNGSLHICSEALEQPLWVVKNKGDAKSFPVEHEAQWWEFSIRKEIEHYVRCLLNDEPEDVTAQDAREVLRVILKCYEASGKSHSRLTV
jgi:predicted dehydrogenase